MLVHSLDPMGLRASSEASHTFPVLIVSSGTVHAPGQEGRPPGVPIDLCQAIKLALRHNHFVKAARTQIHESQAQEMAALRPNPVFARDNLLIPAFSPGGHVSSTLDIVTEFDAGFSRIFERGGKCQGRPASDLYQL
jgi:hypothetical protein